MIEIDGSHGEGGGQIVRTSLALSLITGKAFRVRDVRAGRKNPGLQAQHLAGVRAAARVGSARVTGDAIRSTAFTFEPGHVSAGTYHFAVGTAGATSLVLHAVYLPLALADGPSELTIEGGTHVIASPCFHFLEAVWAEYLRRVGIDVRLAMPAAGFYPRGGGRITALIEGSAVRPLQLTEPAPFTEVAGVSAVAGLPSQIARRQARRAEVRLRGRGIRADIAIEEWDGGPGTAIALIAGRDVPAMGFGVGQRGKPAEKVADDAVDALLTLTASDAPVDPHSADQLILPLMFASGASRFRTPVVTQHLLTNIATVRQFLDRPIACDGEEGSPGTVEIGPAGPAC